MSQRHDYLASPLPARAGMSRLGIGIGAALAVVIVAGIGGILVAQQGERPGGGIVKLGSSEAAPTPAGPSGIPNAANAPRPTAVKAPAQAPANAPAQAQAPANVPAAATRPQAAGSFPPAVYGLDQAARYWAVYLALARTPNDPRIAMAERQAASVGYKQQVSGGDLSCDRGARENLNAAGLHLNPAIEYQTVALYFRTPQQAWAFVDAYRPGVVGTVPMNAYCAD